MANVGQPAQEQAGPKPPPGTRLGGG